MTGPRVWKVKLALERTEDYARVAALLGQCEVGSERQTTHLLDTVDGTFAAAGWCVRLRRTEPLSGQHADTAPQYVASIRAHARSLQDALAQSFSVTDEAIQPSLGERVCNGAFVYAPSGSALFDGVLKLPSRTQRTPSLSSVGSFVTLRTVYQWHDLVLELDRYRVGGKDAWHLQFSVDGLHQEPTLKVMALLQSNHIHFSMAINSKAATLLQHVKSNAALASAVWLVGCSCRDGTNDNGADLPPCPFDLSAVSQSVPTSVPLSLEGHDAVGTAVFAPSAELAVAPPLHAPDIEDVANFYMARSCAPGADDLSWVDPAASLSPSSFVDGYFGWNDPATAAPALASATPQMSAPTTAFASPTFKAEGVSLSPPPASAEAPRPTTTAAMTVPRPQAGANEAKPAAGRASSAAGKGARAAKASSSDGAGGAGATPNGSGKARSDVDEVQRRRSCEASARYRKRKQTELEVLRAQFLESFAENKRLTSRLEELEEINRRLIVRLSQYEPNVTLDAFRP